MSKRGRKAKPTAGKAIPRSQGAALALGAHVRGHDHTGAAGAVGPAVFTGPIRPQPRARPGGEATHAPLMRRHQGR